MALIDLEQYRRFMDVHPQGHVFKVTTTGERRWEGSNRIVFIARTEEIECVTCGEHLGPIEWQMVLGPAVIGSTGNLFLV